MVLFILGSIWLFSPLLIPQILEFAEDIRTLSDDDKQSQQAPWLGNIYVFPVEAPLSPDPSSDAAS